MLVRLTDGREFVVNRWNFVYQADAKTIGEAILTAPHGAELTRVVRVLHDAGYARDWTKPHGPWQFGCCPRGKRLEEVALPC